MAQEKAEGTATELVQVLLVEDNPVNRTVAERLLAQFTRTLEAIPAHLDDSPSALPVLLQPTHSSPVAVSKW